jgi:hypothetical protein
MAVTDTIDWMAALRQFLVSDSGVANEVGDAVYVRKVPRGTNVPGKAVVLVQSGGGVPVRLPVITANVQVRCYGDTSREAREVYRVVRSALHFARRYQIEPGEGVIDGSHWLVSARETSGPSDENEPETGWFFVVSIFGCTFVSFPVGDDEE